MNPGRFRHRVSVEFPVFETTETYGSRLVRWDPLFTGRAEVQDALPSRSEAVLNGLVQGRNQVRIRMLYRADLTSDMRIVVHQQGANRVLQIVGGPAVIENGKGLEMVCEAFGTTGGAS